MALKGRNTFCGPAALAAIFGRGMTTDEAAAMIRRISGQRAVTGTPAGVPARIIRAHGGQVDGVPNLSGEFVWKVVRGRPLTLLTVETDSHFGSHYLVVRRGKVIDSFSREWVLAKDHRWRNARICYALEVTVRPKLPRPNRATKVKETPASLQRKARTFVVRTILNNLQPLRLDDESNLQRQVERLESLLRLARQAGRPRSAFAEDMAQARKAERARRARKKAAEAEACLVIKAGKRVIEEVRESELGRHEDAGCPDHGDVVAAIDRSPPGRICFASADEVADACFALDTGTAFLNEQTHLRGHVDDIVGQLDDWLKRHQSA